MEWKTPDFDKIVKDYKFSKFILREDLHEYMQEPKLLELLIEKERIYKNIFEIELMKEACRISSLIHNKIIYNRQMFKKKKYY